MKSTTTFALTLALTTTAAISPLFLSTAEEETQKLDPKTIAKLLGETQIKPTPPPAPVVPEGTKMTEELTTTIALIENRLIAPMRNYSNRRALMSRIRVRMDVEYHFAITDTSDSLFPFDVYMRHQNGSWEKIASGACHPGMESLKVAMPETGIMVDPIKHPLFAAALTEHKNATEKRAG